MPKKLDLKGKIFGCFKVLDEVEERLNGKVAWLCECECGNTSVVRGSDLTKGKSTNCGCIKVKKLVDRSTTHGMSNSKEYSIYLGMIKRCKHGHSDLNRCYLAKGIKVCERWERSFENFLADMGNIPSSDYSIERLDSNKDYSPENCIWLPLKYQSRNRTKTSNNTSGTTGVSFTGKGFKAYWADINGKQNTKYYSVNKYGYDQALDLAIMYRNKMIAELNRQGAGYSEHHGK